MNWVIIAAGGDGKRIKAGESKVFLPILSKPVVFYTLRTLEKMKLIDKVIITVRSMDKQQWQAVMTQFGFRKIIKLILAGKNRQASTWKVLQWLKGRAADKDLIAVHNAVNPLVQPKEIEAVFKQASQFGAALLAIPARDTVKIVKEDKIVQATPLRQFVWYAQTPQVARFDLIYRAFKKAQAEGFVGTDDSQLLERIGVKVKIVPCSAENLKITYPQDLFLAEKILREREK